MKTKEIGKDHGWYLPRLRCYTFFGLICTLNEVKKPTDSGVTFGNILGDVDIDLK